MKFTVILLVLFLSACGGGGGSGGGGNETPSNGVNGSSTNPPVENNDTPITPSSNNSSSGSSLNQHERKFATVFNSAEDFTTWACSLEGQEFFLLLVLLPDKRGLASIYDLEGEPLDSLEGEWLADAQSMTIFSVEENLQIKFSDYFFLDALSWDATTPVGSEVIDVQCDLYDQDGLV